MSREHYAEAAVLAGVRLTLAEFAAMSPEERAAFSRGGRLWLEAQASLIAAELAPILVAAIAAAAPVSDEQREIAVIHEAMAVATAQAREHIGEPA